MSPFTNVCDLTIDAEWDTMCDVIPSEVDILSSSKEVCKVLEEWTSDDESIDMDIMEVDEQIGSNFLCDDLFGDVTCSSNSQHHDTLPPNDTTFNTEIFLSNDILPKLVDTRYSEAFLKLQESMRRSQETRMALTMKTHQANDAYSRRENIAAVLASIQESGRKLQDCLAPAC
jgi:hypothetical protein